MPRTVGKALEIDIFSKCRLLTGPAGLGNEILWVNILEILDDLRHIEPGEFLITTAHGLDELNQKRHQDMMRLFAAKNVAAIAIQVGHYIKEIPPSFISYAADFRIPLIEIPPEVSFKKITRALMNVIYQDNFIKEAHSSRPGFVSFLESSALEMKNLWTSLLDIDDPKNLYLELSRFSISVLEPVLVLLVGISGLDESTAGSKSGSKSGSKAGLFKSAELSAMNILRQLQLPFLLGPSQDYLSFLFQPGHFENKAGEFESVHLNYLMDHLNIAFAGYTVEAGLSCLHENINGLKPAFEEAEKALQAKRLMLADHGTFNCYQNLGLYQLIMNIEDIGKLRQIYESTVAPITSYDMNCNGSLLQTLHQYLKLGSIKMASEAVFVHRHTMKYRFDLIKELTGFDPLVAEDALQLNIGLCIYFYLKALNFTS